MKFFLDNWYLFLIAFGSGAMLMWPAIKGGKLSGGTLSAAGAVTLINREKAVVIDVSEAEEFAKSHINGSKNVPVGQFETRLPEVQKNKTLPLILVCPAGSRAARMVATAKRLGYDKAQALTGGLRAWGEAGLPLEKSA
jgi:rhodanese-related sulfurtransferase